jgi:predicted aspartyl protease
MSKAIKIPIEVVSFFEDGFHLFVKGKLGEQILRLLIDTGASKTVLDKKFLMEKFPELKLEQNELPATGAGTNTIQTEIAEISDFFLGDGDKENLSSPLQNFPVAVMDLQHVNETYSKIGKESIHGVIGSDLLVDFRATINLKKETLKLNPPKRKKKG